MSVKEKESDSSEAMDAPRVETVALPARIGKQVRWALQVAQVRLRFLFVLAAAFLIVGNWHVLRNYRDASTAPSGSGALGGTLSADTEFFCPMCPGVISGWPTRCSVCNMPLVRRHKGEAVQLSVGVLARMQLSPYRVQLAGIRASAVGYQPLVRDVIAAGRVQRSTSAEAIADKEPVGVAHAAVVAELAEQELPFVAVGA